MKTTRLMQQGSMNICVKNYTSVLVNRGVQCVHCVLQKCIMEN